MGYGVNISVPTPGMTFITDDGVYVRVIPYGDTAVLNEDDAVEAKWLRPENNTESDWTPLQGPNADGEYSGYIPDAPYGAHPLYVLLNIKVRVDFQGNANVPGDV